MDFIGVAVLLPFVLCLQKGPECNNDDIFAMSERNVSIEWTVRNLTMEVVSATISNSSGNITVELAALDCNVLDDSSMYCSLLFRDEEWILSLTLFNVTERQSGNYTLRLFQALEEKDASSKTLLVIGKPIIIEGGKPVPPQPFQHTRNTLHPIKCVIFMWKINGTWITPASQENGKPIIMDVGKPVLHQPFQLTCQTPHRLKCFIFRWKINGTWIAPSSNLNAHHVSSLRMTDNFSHVSCHVCLNKTRGNFSSETLESDSCSKESDIYIIEVTYGPDNISLSVKDSHFYLQEHELFTIDCFANCSPKCTFWWKGQDITEGEKLVITSFEPRMAGQYACYVTNQQTNITIKSDSIILHHVKDHLLSRENEGPQSAKYWIWPVITFVFLLVVGLLIIVTCWRKISVKQINSRELCQPCVGEAHNAVSCDKREGLNRPLPNPAAQENVCRTNRRLLYNNVHRSPVSVENISDPTISFRNQRKENVPLQSYFRSQNTLDRKISNRVNTDDNVNTKRGSEYYSLLCCVEESANENIPLKLFAKANRNNMAAGDDQITAQKYETQKKPVQEYFTQTFQDNPYSTIDDDTLWIDYVTENNSQETGMRTKHVFDGHARSTEMCKDEPVDVHVTAETYLTPISDIAHPFPICQDEEAVMLKTDHTYLALIDDLANPIEICRVEETSMNETNQTYVTPMSE